MDDRDRSPGAALGRTEIDVRTHEVCLRIDGLPHPFVRRSELVGVHSYVRTKSAAQPIYYVEIAAKSGEIVCDYDDRTLRASLLASFAGARLFDQSVGEIG